MVSLRPIDPYPYDKLLPLRALAERHSGGAIDLSVGTPCDAPPAAVVRALGEAQSLRGYPPSIGTVALRSAATEWLSSYLGVVVEPSGVAACVGTKEFVASAPGLLRVLMPARDTVLYPAVSYPTYAMGATLAGCRAVPVALDSATGRLELDSISAVIANERCVCGSTARAIRPGASMTWPRPRAGGGSTRCRSSPTSVTSLSRGPVNPARSCKRASTGSLRCTRCRNVRTWPACGWAFSRAIPRWWNRYASCVNTRV